MVSAPWNLENARLEDDVNGVEGTVSKVVYGVETEHPEVENGALVYVNVDWEVYSHPLKFLLDFIGLASPVELGPFPAEAVDIETVREDMPGKASTRVHIKEDMDGNAPYREDELGESTDNKVTRLQKKVEKLKNKIDRKNQDIRDLESRLEVEGYQPPSRSGSSSSSSGDDDGTVPVEDLEEM